MIAVRNHLGRKPAVNGWGRCGGPKEDDFEQENPRLGDNFVKPDITFYLNCPASSYMEGKEAFSIQGGIQLACEDKMEMIIWAAIRPMKKVQMGCLLCRKPKDMDFFNQVDWLFSQKLTSRCISGAGR
jgi:hypothetical protein